MTVLPEVDSFFKTLISAYQLIDYHNVQPYLGKTMGFYNVSKGINKAKSKSKLLSQRLRLWLVTYELYA